MSALTKVAIYTDGSCKNNPGPGGYGAVLEYEKDGILHTKELSRGYKHTTNNRMELLAVLAALSALKYRCHVSITTDSQYVKNGMTSWCKSWKKNNWRTSAGQPVKNQDLWIKLDTLCSQHEVEWFWVRGHNGHPQNERCDELAQNAANSPEGSDDGEP